MKTIKKLSEVADIATGELFLMKCPATGIVHVMKKYRYSSSQSYYMSRQGYNRGRVTLLWAVTRNGRMHRLTRTDLQTEDMKYIISCRG